MSWRERTISTSIAVAVICLTAAGPVLADDSTPPIASMSPSYPASSFVSTTSPVYSRLTCNAGSWQSSTPVTLTISWMRGDVTVDTGSGYVVGPNDPTLGIPVCRVTATNAAGTSVVTLGPAPTFPLDPRRPAYARFGGTLIVRVDRQGSAAVLVSCQIAGADGCHGTLTLERGHTPIGSGGFAIAGVANETGRVPLTASWRRILARHRLLDARLLLKNASGSYTWQPVVLDGRSLTRTS